MNKVKSTFSIKDFENLSNIKAHTIRIWEKRYQIFSPDRNNKNNREYTSNDLRKLLNIVFLNKYGYKISHIATLSDDEMNKLVRTIYSQNKNTNYSINILKLAMFNFDTALFYETHTELIKSYSFEYIFSNVYLPLLNEIGLLWQTLALKPVHEHFISELITHKLIENISLVQNKTTFTETDFVFVLFLPENEIHEITILYINYLLLSRGYNTIYLGANIPADDLKELKLSNSIIYYVSHFTVAPSLEDINAFIEYFDSTFLQNKNKFFVSGNQTNFITSTNDRVIRIENIDQLLEKINYENLQVV